MGSHSSSAGGGGAGDRPPPPPPPPRGEPEGPDPEEEEEEEGEGEREEEEEEEEEEDVDLAQVLAYLLRRGRAGPARGGGGARRDPPDSEEEEEEEEEPWGGGGAGHDPPAPPPPDTRVLDGHELKAQLELAGGRGLGGAGPAERSLPRLLRQREWGRCRNGGFSAGEKTRLSSQSDAAALRVAGGGPAPLPSLAGPRRGLEHPRRRLQPRRLPVPLLQLVRLHPRVRHLRGRGQPHGPRPAAGRAPLRRLLIGRGAGRAGGGGRSQRRLPLRLRPGGPTPHPTGGGPRGRRQRGGAGGRGGAAAALGGGRRRLPGLGPPLPGGGAAPPRRPPGRPPRRHHLPAPPGRRALPGLQLQGPDGQAVGPAAPGGAGGAGGRPAGRGPAELGLSLAAGAPPRHGDGAAAGRQLADDVPGSRGAAHAAALPPGPAPRPLPGGRQRLGGGAGVRRAEWAGRAAADQSRRLRAGRLLAPPGRGPGHGLVGRHRPSVGLPGAAGRGRGGGTRGDTPPPAPQRRPTINRCDPQVPPRLLLVSGGGGGVRQGDASDPQVASDP
ncbi:DDB1- and CUL4-associated factor 11 isoform X3 [Larus michahellis]|uniref:DDB1- and CUL4-associated factor 11 isoform X3 n=1 Tax=Larus michahellis TaxID=119627 RepID=UPI003D9BBB4F